MNPKQHNNTPATMQRKTLNNTTQTPSRHNHNPLYTTLTLNRAIPWAGAGGSVFVRKWDAVGRVEPMPNMLQVKPQPATPNP